MAYGTSPPLPSPSTTTLHQLVEGIQELISDSETGSPPPKPSPYGAIAPTTNHPPSPVMYETNSPPPTSYTTKSNPLPPPPPPAMYQTNPPPPAPYTTTAKLDPPSSPVMYTTSHIPASYTTGSSPGTSSPVMYENTSIPPASNTVTAPPADGVPQEGYVDDQSQETQGRGGGGIFCIFMTPINICIYR